MQIKCLLVSLLITSFVVSFASIGRAVNDQDLIFFMSFDKVSGDTLLDDSGNGNTGTLKGDAKITKNGNFGSALSVSGEGYVDCGNGKILNQDFPGKFDTAGEGVVETHRTLPADGLTIEAWVYPKAHGGIQMVVSGKFDTATPAGSLRSQYKAIILGFS